MKQNKLKSGITLSELGLGCMSLGTDEKQAQAIIERALELGITYFDTADLYDKGVNESIVGRVLKSYQNDDAITIGTKVGNQWFDDGSTKWNPSKAYIKDAVKDSLKRLQLDVIDLYQLHGGTIDDPLDETISAFDELKEEGYIKAYGLSSIRPNVIHYYLAHSQIETLMSQFNLVDNRPEALLPNLAEKDVKLLARGPLFKGLLTEHSHRILQEKFEEGVLDYDGQTLSDSVNQLTSIDKNLTALAYAYLAQQQSMGSIITGASSVAQLEENVENYHLARQIKQADIDDARAVMKNLAYTQHTN